MVFGKIKKNNWFEQRIIWSIYRGQNLFLMRQFASKLKTMRFTMGTLTVLFTVAFLGCSVALMFTDWQKQVLGIKFPFDIQVYHQDRSGTRRRSRIPGLTGSGRITPMRSIPGCTHICGILEMNIRRQTEHRMKRKLPERMGKNMLRMIRLWRSATIITCGRCLGIQK